MNYDKCKIFSLPEKVIHVVWVCINNYISNAFLFYFTQNIPKN